MELHGQEQRIRALFRELKREDELAAPRFAAVLSRARHGTAIVTLNFVRLAAAVLTILFVVLSLALLSSHWRRGRQSREELVNGPASGAERVTNKSEPNGPSVREDRPESSGIEPTLISRRSTPKPGAGELPIRGRTGRVDSRLSGRNSFAISRWQSPTTPLLRSPVDEMLKSLPQLDRSARELKVFLPHVMN